MYVTIGWQAFIYDNKYFLSYAMVKWAAVAQGGIIWQCPDNTRIYI